MIIMIDMAMMMKMTNSVMMIMTTNHSTGHDSTDSA